ncbi:hypothetical protein N7470_005918 [Penicillium chermesinum]|nr:hypothetical protein N7470_005918 [Penicillium chermesinum]
MDTNFSALKLSCPINADDITARWMNPYIPVPGQAVKSYPPAVTALISRNLESYAAISVRGRHLVPFIHPAQLSGLHVHGDSPLVVCLGLLQSWGVPGSENALSRVIWDEMRTICDKRNEYEAIDLLGAFQAFLLYMLVLFFRLGQTPDNQLRQAMMDLQALATLAAKKGLTCIADNDHSSPLWEEWIVTEAKRRTLYVMYLFDSVLSSQENLPTFLGTELQGLPAPAGKYLWQAGTRAEWKHLYNVHLVEWPERLTIDELWPIPADMDAAEEMERRKRVNHWLEDVDEYGAMLYAVTSITHGV